MKMSLSNLETVGCWQCVSDNSLGTFYASGSLVLDTSANEDAKLHAGATENVDGNLAEPTDGSILVSGDVHDVIDEFGHPGNFYATPIEFVPEFGQIAGKAKTRKKDVGFGANAISLDITMVAQTEEVEIGNAKSRVVASPKIPWHFNGNKHNSIPLHKGETRQRNATGKVVGQNLAKKTNVKLFHIFIVIGRSAIGIHLDSFSATYLAMATIFLNLVHVPWTGFRVAQPSGDFIFVVFVNGNATSRVGRTVQGGRLDQFAFLDEQSLGGSAIVSIIGTE